MRKYKYFMLTLSLLGLMPQGLYATSIDNVTNIATVQQEEAVASDVVQEGAVLTKQYILETVKDTKLYTRYEILLEDKEVITEDVLAELLCYTLGYGPIYHKEQSPYKARLQLENQWPNLTAQVDGTYTCDQWQEILSQYIYKALEKPETFQDYIKPNYFTQMYIGSLRVSNLQAIIDGSNYPLYQLGNTNYISISTLEQLGFDIQHTDQALLIKNPYSLLANKNYEEKILSDKQSEIGGKPVYIGNFKTYSIIQNTETYIPIRSLNEYFHFKVEGASCVLTKRESYTDQYISIQGNKMINNSDKIVDVWMAYYFWDGQTIREEKMFVEALQPGETYPLLEKMYMNEASNIQLSRVVYEMQEKGEVPFLIIKNEPMAYGQMDKELFKLYEKNKKLEEMKSSMDFDKLFPETKIIGTMKYATKGLEKGEQIQVSGAEDGSYYYVMKKGQKITVPWNSISIPANPPVQKEQASKEALEAFVNEQGYTSDTKYLVWTDLYRQTTYVFEKKSNQWVLVRSMLCTTGNNKTPTPPGQYKLGAYVPSFGQNKGYQCKNAVGFIGTTYLYHSVMYNKAGTYVLGGQVLGKQGSHGCIRLSPENSEWFYQTMPLQTKVIIR